jgi:hypothetical protein
LVILLFSFLSLKSEDEGGLDRLHAVHWRFVGNLMLFTIAWGRISTFRLALAECLLALPQWRSAMCGNNNRLRYC